MVIITAFYVNCISILTFLDMAIVVNLSLSTDMANIVLLLVIIMLVFSVIGITLFRDIVPKYFGSLSTGILFATVCYRVCTCLSSHQLHQPCFLMPVQLSMLCLQYSHRPTSNNNPEKLPKINPEIPAKIFKSPFSPPKPCKYF